MRRITVFICACLGAALLFAGRSDAATSTATTFNVQITIQAACTISVNTLDFGNAGVLATNVDSTNTVTVTCTNTTPWAVSLNGGTGSGGTVTLRRMTSGGATVDYTIYRDSAHTQVWGDGTAGTFTVAGTGSGSGQPQTGYGRVPAQPTPAAGTYTDTITATVTF